MKIVIPALAAAFIGTVGVGSSAQAAVIDFSFVALGSHISASPVPLQAATSINLDGSLLVVSGSGASDSSGLSAGDSITISPTDIVFGATAGPLASDVTKSWTDALGSFKETLTTVASIDRSSPNAITVDLLGTIMGPGVDGQTVSLIIDATQSGGPGRVISVSGSNSSAVPEPATWVMLALGFAGLGYAAVRRSAKDKVALAI